MHDASNRVHMNHYIRVQDQVKFTGPGELAVFLEDREKAGVKSFAVVGDVSKAHRSCTNGNSLSTNQYCHNLLSLLRHAGTASNDKTRHDGN